MVLAIQNLGRISVKGGGQMASGKDAFNEFLERFATMLELGNSMKMFLA